MILFVVALCVVLSSAARLENTYLPPTSAQSAGGSGNFLATPRGSSGFGGGPAFGGNPAFGQHGGVGIGGGFGSQGGFGASSGSKFGSGAGSGYGGKSGFGGPGFGGAPGFGGVSGAVNRPFPAAPVGPSAFGHGGQGGQGGFRAGGGFPGGPQIPILKYSNENYGDGTYHYDYATGNGINAQESGQQKQLGNEQANDVRGDFSFTADDGQQYAVSYIADENGFQPQGAHLPTPPPIPEEILRSLQQNAAEEARNPHRGSDDGNYYDDGARSGYPSGPSGSSRGGFGTHGGQGSFSPQRGPGGFGGPAGGRGSFGGGSFGSTAGSRQYIPPSKPGYTPQAGYNY